jgi:hypothetical protein
LVAFSFVRIHPRVIGCDLVAAILKLEAQVI